MITAMAFFQIWKMFFKCEIAEVELLLQKLFRHDSLNDDCIWKVQLKGQESPVASLNSLTFTHGCFFLFFSNSPFFVLSVETVQCGWNIQSSVTMMVEHCICHNKEEKHLFLFLEVLWVEANEGKTISGVKRSTLFVSSSTFTFIED